MTGYSPYSYVRADGKVFNTLPEGWVDLKRAMREIAQGSTMTFPGAISIDQLVVDLSTMGWQIYRMANNDLVVSDPRADVMITLSPTTNGQTKIRFNVNLPDWEALIEELSQLETRAGVKRHLEAVEREDHALDLLLGVIELIRFVTEPKELFLFKGF